MAEFGGASIGGVAPWGMTVAPRGGGAWEGKPVATPPGWGRGVVVLADLVSITEHTKEQHRTTRRTTSNNKTNPTHLNGGASANARGPPRRGRAMHPFFPSNKGAGGGFGTSDSLGIRRTLE